jgi:hypothetical protein
VRLPVRHLTKELCQIDYRELTLRHIFDSFKILSISGSIKAHAAQKIEPSLQLSVNPGRFQDGATSEDVVFLKNDGIEIRADFREASSQSLRLRILQRAADGTALARAVANHDRKMYWNNAERCRGEMVIKLNEFHASGIHFF